MFEDRPLGSLTIDEIRSVDLAGLSPDEQLDLAVLLKKATAILAAETMRVEAGFADAYFGTIANPAHYEYALASNVRDREAGHDLYKAELFAGPLLAVREAMSAGDLDVRHADAILSGARHMLSADTGDELTQKSLAAVESVMPAAVEYAMDHTPAQVARTVRRWLKIKDPATAEQRREQAMGRRAVSFEVTADGLGQLLIEGNPVFLYLVYLSICAAGDYDKSHAEEGDRRSRANFHADAAIGVLYDATLSRDPHGFEEELAHMFEQVARGDARAACLGTPMLATVRPSQTSPWHWNRDGSLRRLMYDEDGAAHHTDGMRVDADPSLSPPRRVEWGAPTRGKLRRQGVAPIRISIVMDEATFAERADNPAVVDGQFEITASAARELLRCAGFERLLVDRNGALIEKSSMIYEPSRELRELVNARFGTCQKPNCDVPAHRCQFDHRVPFNKAEPARGGLTTVGNGGPLCPGDHHGKTKKLFDVKQVDGGELFYVTPLGREYRVELADHRPGSVPV